MHLAAQEGHLSTLKALLRAGSPVEAKAHDGKTCLRVAALENHRDMVLYLLQHTAADVKYRDADGRSTLYVLALENQVEMAAVLLEHGADSEAGDLEGRTPLHVACWQGHYQMVHTLLQYKAAVDAVDNECRTALQSASWQGHASIVNLLLECAASVDHTCNQGATALCIAAQEGHQDVVRVLLQHHAAPNHADQFGRTAMRVAIKGGHQNVVKILDEFGALPPSTSSSTNSRGGGGGGGRSSGGSGSTGTTPITTHNTNTQITSQPSFSAPVPSQLLQQATAIANGQFHLLTHGSSSPSPGSSLDKQHQQHNTQRSTNSSNNKTNTVSTNQSSGSSGADTSSSQLTFTQQLQQCSRHKHRPVSKVLSPVNEPGGGIYANLQSPPSTPYSNAATPESPVTQQPPPPPPPRQPSPGHTIHIISNPGMEPYSEAEGEEPVWQPRSSDPSSCSMPSMAGSGITMGSTALSLKSPDTRKKRNGIVTNPNYANSVNVNGYLNKLANLDNDSFDDNFHDVDTPPVQSSMPKKPTRPNGLPLKKETPL